MPFGTNTPPYSTGLSRIGEMPRPAPPIVQPEVVADAVVYAASHPIRVRSSEEAQRSGIPIDENQPNSLFEAVPGWRIHGEFDDESIDRSPYVLFQIGNGTPDAVSEVDALSEVDDMLEMLIGAPESSNLGIDPGKLRDVVRMVIELQATGWKPSFSEHRARTA